MVLPLVILKESTRNLLSSIAATIHFIAFLMSAGLLLSNAVFHISSSDSLVLLLSKQSILAGYIPLIISIISGSITVLHLWSWIYVKDQRQRHSRWKPSAIRDGVLINVVAGVLSLGCLLLHGFYCYKFEKYLSLGFFEGMLQSNEITSMKAAVDTLQLENHCCGINSIKDWFDTSNIDLHGGSSDYISKPWSHCQNYANKPQACYVPYSCCRLEENFCSPWAFVIESMEPLNAVDHNYSATKRFHEDGCIPVLSAHPFSWVQMGILIVLFIVEVVAAILTQLLATSTFVIEKIGAEEDTEIPAWILPFGKYRPQDVIEHTLYCFARDENFNFMTLEESRVRRDSTTKMFCKA